MVKNEISKYNRLSSSEISKALCSGEPATLSDGAPCRLLWPERMKASGFSGGVRQAVEH